jgi:hypothetical protein
MNPNDTTVVVVVAPSAATANTLGQNQHPGSRLMQQ